MREGENPEVGRVSGYRQLSDSELAMVNALKDGGASIEALLMRAEEVINQDLRLNTGERKRALALAKTNLQQGFMWAIRAVAAPQGFA